jgi:hydrogenase maturation protein HypF
MTAATINLPQRAPLPVLALGAYLKNAACRLQGGQALFSPLHGDLGDADACRALDASAHALLADGPAVAALAHDLHPDFPSTRAAQALASAQALPAWPVQHHRAHLGVVQAEAGLRGPVLGLALDGVGLGSDGQAWGGELLWADDPARSSRWQRVAHLPALPLPGGDRAARDPWRMTAALLWQQGRTDEIPRRLADAAGQGHTAALQGLQALLQRQLNCPPTTAAGRWFDAMAAGLGLHRGAQGEAEAAVALQCAASAWLAEHPAQGRSLQTDALSTWTLERLPAQAVALLDLAPQRSGEAAVRFHFGLAGALAQACIQQAMARDVGCIVLSGGCLANRLLAQALREPLQAAGLRVVLPQAAGCGDAGLALGQAWLASWAQARGDAGDALAQPQPVEA